MGGLRAASEQIVEGFELEKASGKTLAWNNLTKAAFHDLHELRTAYFTAQYGGPQVVQRFASGTLLTIAKKLGSNSSSNSTTVIVGHDNNVLAVGASLEMKWACGQSISSPGWSVNSTPPLSGLLFARKGHSVNM